MPLCEYHNVTLVANDAAAYTPCSRPHRKLMLTTTRHIQYFFPSLLKARSTILISVEYITFYQISLFDDVHKVFAVFTGHKLCFWYVFEYTPHILKYGGSGLKLTLKLPA